MTQWVDLQPNSILAMVEVGSVEPRKIITIEPCWKIVNNTPLPLTLESIEVHVSRDSGWEISEFEINEVISPTKDSQNYFTFFAPVILTESESADFLSESIGLSIAIDVVYHGASGKPEKQSFGDLYVCSVGKLEINKPIGKGPQSQRIEEYHGPSTIVGKEVEILVDSDKSPSQPT
jgi:hypothetical protein